MNYEEKLKIARLAYKKIREAIDEFEKDEKMRFYAYWDGCIGLDDELFHEHQLT